MAMHPVRKQRLIVLLVIISGISLAVGLSLLALGENINHFYTPKQISEGNVPVDKTIRIGGLVLSGSMKRGDGLQVQFVLTDNGGDVEVLYDGILPDLFREGQGIVATGKLQASGQFVAQEVLAKHDENYMPPEVKKALEEAGHPVSADK